MRTTCYALLILWTSALAARAQTVLDTFAVTPRGDTAWFWAQIPTGYSPLHPPALLVWWHGWGGSRMEMANSTLFDEEANARGWTAASHFGPNDRHYNGWRAQEHCRAMMDWLHERYPFDLDSIYMAGGSMGGAAGQVWHNNNCGSDDYLIAATAGGSQILDCQLRQEQYLADGDTNWAMVNAFGGFPSDRDSVAFEYHRASAVFLADTTQSMHFNSLHLPVWSSWGNTDLERLAYGGPARAWDSLRRADHADTTVEFESLNSGHGLAVMPAAEVCDWLAGFAANRYPDQISINADQSGSYYWTDVVLAREDTTLARYGAYKDEATRQLDVTLVRNVERLTVNFDFPWSHWDSLSGHWQSLDPASEPVTVVLRGVPSVTAITRDDGVPIDFVQSGDEVTVEFSGDLQVTLHFALENASRCEAFISTTPQLLAAYPNPFNSSVSFVIESPHESPASILLYDVTGRRVAEINGPTGPGTHRVKFDTAALGSGSYFAVLRGSQHVPMKVVLIR